MWHKMKCVFLDQATFSSSVSFNAIEQTVDSLTGYPLTAPSDVVERCTDTEIIITNKVVITDDVMKQLPSLKLICIAATGTNNVDLPAAQKRGIAVTNVSGYSQHSVAQYVFAQLLDYFANPRAHQQTVEQGLWQKSSSFCVHGVGSQELAGKTLAIIGYGSLGKAVANIAQAFGMKVLISARKGEKQIKEGRVSFEYAIQHADVISLHCPLTSSTNNLIDKNTLALMKTSAILINTARGGVVNESDLLAALQTDQIAFAVLDVLTQEPPSEDNPLLLSKPDNLKITPHIAWASIESQQRLISLVAQNILAFKNHQMLNRVEQ